MPYKTSHISVVLHTIYISPYICYTRGEAVKPHHTHYIDLILAIARWSGGSGGGTSRDTIKCQKDRTLRKSWIYLVTFTLPVLFDVKQPDGVTGNSIRCPYTSVQRYTRERRGSRLSGTRGIYTGTLETLSASGAWQLEETPECPRVWREEHPGLRGPFTPCAGPSSTGRIWLLRMSVSFTFLKDTCSLDLKRSLVVYNFSVCPFMRRHDEHLRTLLNDNGHVNADVFTLLFAIYWLLCMYILYYIHVSNVNFVIVRNNTSFIVYRFNMYIVNMYLSGTLLYKFPVT